MEACTHLHRALQQIHELGKSAGVALNPGTTASAVGEVLAETDLILAMTVNPGASGQAFIPGVLPKIRQLAEMVRGRSPGSTKAQARAIEIEADGGLDPDTAPQAAGVGHRGGASPQADLRVC